MTDEITWAEPPERKNGRKPRNPQASLAVADALRLQPGRYARVAVRTSRSASQQLAGNIKFARDDAFAPAGTFTATVRQVDGQFEVYAKKVEVPQTAMEPAADASWVQSKPYSKSLEK